MGFMDKFSKMIGGNKPSKIETVKGPSLTLKENGIDPAGLKFSFHKDGSIEVDEFIGCQQGVTQGPPGVQIRVHGL